MQNIVALLLIAWAVLYVAWRVGRMFFRKSAGGCGSGCAKCPAAKGTPTNLVSVDSLLKASHRQS
jgi:hypothetical protein